MRLPCFRHFHDGTRRASPVARHVLITVLSLPPRRSVMTPRSARAMPCCLRPERGTGKVRFLGGNLKATYDFAKKAAHIADDKFSSPEGKHSSQPTPRPPRRPRNPIHKQTTS